MFRRHPRTALLLLCLATLAAGTISVLLWAQYHLRTAQQAIEQFALAEALHHLKLCLKVRRGNAALNLLAARTARRCDEYDEAEKYLTESIKLGGMTPEVSLERMLLSAQKGELDGVETSLRGRAGEDDPDAAIVLEALAKGYASRFWESNVLVCLNILLQRQPHHPLALLMRARAWDYRALHGEKERNNDALDDYRQAVELNPSFEAQLGLAGALYRVGRPWEAMLLYERLQASQPANSDVLLGLARCRYSLHEVEAAQQLLDELLDHSPNQASALLERGRLAMHSGELDEAEKWLSRAAAAAPRHDVEAQRILCRCLEAHHKSPEAGRCREELNRRELKVFEVERLILRANRQPQDVALRYDIATELLRLGREQEGVAALFFVLEQKPHHGPAREALADYFERHGQTSRAARYRRAIFPGTRSGLQSR